jgi:hypothetical protein
MVAAMEHGALPLALLTIIYQLRALLTLEAEAVVVAETLPMVPAKMVAVVL